MNGWVSMCVGVCLCMFVPCLLHYLDPLLREITHVTHTVLLGIPPGIRE